MWVEVQRPPLVEKEDPISSHPGVKADEIIPKSAGMKFPT